MPMPMPMPMPSPARLSRATLARQMLLHRERLSMPAAVHRLCALQAQESRPPFLALWSRLADFTTGELRAALKQGTVLRVTLMRGTLHLVTAADYPLLRAPLQPVLAESHTALGDRAAGIELDRVLPAARAAFASGPMTFDELRARLAPQFPGLDERVLGYAVRMNLPLVMVPTEDRWGYPRVSRFALTAPFATVADPDELVLRYLAAFGSATAADAQAFTGLPRLKPALDRLAPQLVTFRDERGRTLYDLPGASRPDGDSPAPPRLLPDFDNLLLGYADRTRFLPDAFKGQVTTRNLRVRATFLHDGVIRGTWAITRTGKAATLTLTPFEPLDASAVAAPWGAPPAAPAGGFRGVVRPGQHCLNGRAAWHQHVSRRQLAVVTACGAQCRYACGAVTRAAPVSRGRMGAAWPEGLGGAGIGGVTSTVKDDVSVVLLCRSNIGTADRGLGVRWQSRLRAARWGRWRPR